ncbi:MAG: hypothetical protein WAM96_05805 [Candidatus Acidiferrales bacterium]
MAGLYFGEQVTTIPFWFQAWLLPAGANPFADRCDAEKDGEAIIRVGHLCFAMDDIAHYFLCSLGYRRFGDRGSRHQMGVHNPVSLNSLSADQ